MMLLNLFAGRKCDGPLLRACLLPATLIFAIGMMPKASGGVIFLNGETGNDLNRGDSLVAGELGSGPIRTLQRASVLLNPGDRLEVTKTSEPYYGSLSLTGKKHSGVPSLPLVIVGQGAVFDGSLPIDPADWRPHGQGLWSLTPNEKGWYVLIRENALPRSVLDPRNSRPQQLAAGEWEVWGSEIYYRALPDEIPMNEPFRLATERAGIFLLDVENVIVEDLTLQHYRLDGVNAHDRVDRVLLKGITSQSNGRSGVFVGGTAKLALENCTLIENDDASLLLRELGTAALTDCKLDTEPVRQD